MQILPSKSSSIELAYDPDMLCLLKLKLPSHSSQNNVRKNGIFLLRNYRNTRRFLTAVSNAVQVKSEIKCEPNPYLKQKTNYRNSPLHMNGHSSETDSSDSGSNHRSLLTCNNLGRGLRAAIENDPGTINSMIKHTQLFSEICMKIRSHLRQKLILMLQAEDNLIKPTNGDKPWLNGTLKRPYCNDSFENAFVDGFCSFKPIFELIRTTPFIRTQFFETEMIKYIQKQLQTLIEFPSDKVLFKRAKFSTGAVYMENDMKNSIYGDSAIFSQRQIKSLEKGIVSSLEGTLRERKCDIEEIVKKASNGDFDSSCLSLSTIIKHLNKMENNNLSDFSKKKMNIFSKNLCGMKLSDIFECSQHPMFDLTSNIEKQVCNDIHNSSTHDMALKSSLAPKPPTEVEEIIRCICGSMREEGQMIQCDRCQVWQHFDCAEQFCDIGDLEDSEYLCETCQPRTVPLDIPYPSHIPNFDVEKVLPPMKYYRSLESPVVKGLRIKLGDCVYIYRKSDNKINPINQAKMKPQKRPKSNHPSTHEQQTENMEIVKKNFIESLKGAAATAVKNLEHTFNRRECIIIRVEHLAVIESTNQRILYGYHYLWPEETYHEPSRKFYTNEVLQSPNQEWAALDEVRDLCCVLDPATYCKGRPMAFRPDDIFICDYRVDRFAKSFAKRKKFNYPICTKSYAFEMFDSKLKIKRTYSPHLLPEHERPSKSKHDQTDAKQGEGSASAKEKTKNSKMEHLRIIANKLNESAYYWYLLLEQEQDKKSDLDMV